MFRTRLWGDDSWSAFVFVFFRDFRTFYKRDSRRLLGPRVMEEAVGWKVSLVTGSQMKGRGQERCSHSQAQRGGMAMWNCVHVSVSVCLYSHESVHVALFVLICVFSPALVVFWWIWTFYLLASPNLCTRFVVCQSICLSLFQFALENWWKYLNISGLNIFVPSFSDLQGALLLKRGFTLLGPCPTMTKSCCRRYFGFVQASNTNRRSDCIVLRPLQPSKSQCKNRGEEPEWSWPLGTTTQGIHSWLKQLQHHCCCCPTTQRVDLATRRCSPSREKNRVAWLD